MAQRDLCSLGLALGKVQNRDQKKAATPVGNAGHTVVNDSPSVGQCVYGLAWQT